MLDNLGENIRDGLDHEARTSLYLTPRGRPHRPLCRGDPQSSAAPWTRHLSDRPLRCPDARWSQFFRFLSAFGPGPVRFPAWRAPAPDCRSEADSPGADYRFGGLRHRANVFFIALKSSLISPIRSE